MSVAFVRTQDAPTLPAPSTVVGWQAALRQRFMPTPLSGVASIVVGTLLVWVLWTILDWALVRAVFVAPDR
jgi:general L-amino acid transport system permease protein